MSQSSRDIEVFSLAASATNLWRVIESYGMDPGAMFRAAGSDFAPPSAAGSKLPFFLVDRIRAHAAELSGDEAFGLRVARVFHPSQLDSLGFAWLASYSLRDGFARLARFAKVVNTRASLHVSDTADGLSVEHAIAVDSLNPVVMNDTWMALTMALCKVNAGENFTPSSVCMTRPAPRDIAPFEALFGVRPLFGQAANVMLIAAEDADRQHLGANPLIAQMHDELTARFLGTPGNDFVSRARDIAIRRLTSGDISIEVMASELNISARSVRRRLEEQGQNFRTLLDDVRKELAEAYLSTNTLALSEVAYMLGFSSQSAFSRAYQRWHGVAPSHVRNLEQSPS